MGTGDSKCTLTKSFPPGNPSGLPSRSGRNLVAFTRSRAATWSEPGTLPAALRLPPPPPALDFQPSSQGGADGTKERVT